MKISKTWGQVICFRKEKAIYSLRSEGFGQKTKGKKQPWNLSYHNTPDQPAKIAKDIADDKWSSYSEYMERRQIVDKEYGLSMFSDNFEAATGRFVKFLRETSGDSCLDFPEVKVHGSDDDLRQMGSQRFGIEIIKNCHETRKKKTT